MGGGVGGGGGGGGGVCFFQAEDGIRDLVRSRGLGDVYKRQGKVKTTVKDKTGNALQADYIWTFSTGAIISPMVILTDPAHNEINVNLNKVVMATSVSYTHLTLPTSDLV